MSDISSIKFLDQLNRVVARRRRVSSDICWDTATKLVGPSYKLLEWKKFMFNPSTQDAIRSYCPSEETTLNIIRPKTSHFGGRKRKGSACAQPHEYAVHV